jgi:protein-S-isoprenylcysteine O-methyltransferase Ste14
MVHVPPPVVAAAAAVIQRVLTPSAPPPGPARRTLCAGVCLPSVALMGSAIAQFRRRGTTIDPVRPETASELVTTGPNAITRNPMYVGLTGLLVGHAVWRGSWTALAPVAGFVAFTDRFQVQVEEAALAEKFGAAYDGYLADTPRWLGAVSLRRVSGKIRST